MNERLNPHVYPPDDYEEPRCEGCGDPECPITTCCGGPLCQCVCEACDWCGERTLPEELNPLRTRDEDDPCAGDMLCEVCRQGLDTFSERRSLESYYVSAR